jgi:hypothetical protein
LTCADDGADSGIPKPTQEQLSQLSLNGAASPVSHEFGLIRDLASNVLLLSVFILAAALCGCSLIAPLVSAAMPYAGAKMMFACIPEHTSVDTPAGSRPIELLEAGDSVIGFGGKPVRILQKHSYLEDPRTVFLRITFVGGASVNLCGMHRVAGIRAQRIRIGQSIAGREVTRIESRHGETHSFDLLTEDAGYQIHGVPVNSMIEEMNETAASGMRFVRQ